MTAYGCFAVSLRTRQGCPLAVGGLCLPERTEDWRRRVAELEALGVTSQDLYEIDYALAQAIGAISDETLLLAGASIDSGARLPAGARTGGVLGRPRDEIASADGQVEQLPDGFFQWALPGGPGLAAAAPAEAVMAALEALRVLEGPPEEAAVRGILQEQGISAGVVVFDGTGGRGFLLALSGEHCESVLLPERAS